MTNVHTHGRSSPPKSSELANQITAPTPARVFYALSYLKRHCAGWQFWPRICQQRRASFKLEAAILDQLLD